MAIRTSKIFRQACAYGQYNDRFAYTTMVDMEIHQYFGVCKVGPCGFLEQQNVY